MYRGSRKHVLDWTAQPHFAVELLRLLAPVDCRLAAASDWQPAGPGLPTEARLEQFGPRVLPGSPAWPALTAWWLRHPQGANTPNWDLAAACEVEGRPGLVLVEAKANVPELSAAGKRQEPGASARSVENHAHIGAAIAEARDGLRPLLPDVRIGHASHYQLANRLAFGWRLASLGVPTVLVYLGFTGDSGIADVGEPFADESHWRRVFGAHLAAVGAAPALDRRLDLGPAPLWLLARSRPVLAPSPQAA